MSERSTLSVWTLVAPGIFAAIACTGDDVVLYRVTHAGGANGGTGASDAGAPPPRDAGAGGAETGGAGMGVGGGPIGGTGGRASGGAGAGGVGNGGTGAGGIGNGGTGNGGSGTGGRSSGPCTVSSDCPSGWTCAFQSCAAPTGACEPRPILCDPQPVPVCGCDGVTYWNDCVRQQFGVAAATIGQCGGNASPCDKASDCGFPEASCAHVVPETLPCTSPAKGSCWVVPTDCSSTPQSPRWVLCPAPGTPVGTPLQCENTCAAIRSGQSYVAIAPGPTCP